MRNQNGFSLLEVMISMVVLGIGLLGLAPMVMLSIDSNTTSQDILSASTVAKEKMEYFESLSAIPALPYEEHETDLYGGYERITYIRDNVSDSLLPEGVCRIDVTIRWTAEMGVMQSTTYSTLLDKG